MVNEKIVGFPDDLRKRFVCKVEGKPYIWENPTVRFVKYDGNPCHMVELEGTGTYENRRQAFRLFIGEEMAITLQSEDSKETIMVLVRDISETGIGFLTNKELKEGDLVRVRIKTKEYVMNLNARILRSRYEESARSMLYGCKFTDIVPKLSQYIMERQREKMKVNSKKTLTGTNNENKRKDGKANEIY